MRNFTSIYHPNPLQVDAVVHVNLADITNPPAQNLANQFDFGPVDEEGSQAVADMNVSTVSDVDNILSAIDVDNSGVLS